MVTATRKAKGNKKKGKEKGYRLQTVGCKENVERKILDLGPWTLDFGLFFPPVPST
jgi:hypothetical protein